MKKYIVNKYGTEIEGIAIKPNSIVFMDNDYVYDKNKKKIIKLNEGSLGNMLWNKIMECAENKPDKPLFKIGDLVEFEGQACVISNTYELNNKNCYDIKYLRLLNGKLSTHHTHGAREDTLVGLESKEYILEDHDKKYIIKIRRN